MHRAEALGGLGEIELDHFRRARTDEEQRADVRAAFEQAVYHPVELVLRIDHAGKIALFHDRGGKARLGEDHHARRRLQQVRAGAAAYHEEEGILHLAVQPDDPGQAAEDLALPAFAQDGALRVGSGTRQLGRAAIKESGRVHAGTAAV